MDAKTREIVLILLDLPVGNITNAKYTILGSTVAPTTILETPADRPFDFTIYNNLISGKLDGTLILGQGVVAFDIDSIVALRASGQL